MAEFFGFLLLCIFGGKETRQDLAEFYARQAEMQRRRNEDTRNLIATMDEIMADSTADLLASHRRHRAKRTARLSLI